MRRWEYEACNITDPKLSLLGRNGWEAFAAQGGTIYLKRELRESDDGEVSRARTNDAGVSWFTHAQRVTKSTTTIDGMNVTLERDESDEREWEWSVSHFDECWRASGRIHSHDESDVKRQVLAWAELLGRRARR